MDNRRILLKNSKIETVDLNLPNGTLWTSGNICKDSSGNYYIGNEWDYGCYFSWGNVDGYNSTDIYNFNRPNYSNTLGNKLGVNDIPFDQTYDAAYKYFGYNFRIPTVNEFEELANNTDREWTSFNGINGYKLMNKLNHNVYIFLPASGFYSTSVQKQGLVGTYYSTSVLDNDHAYFLYFTSTSFQYSAGAGTNRYIGMNIRPVCSPT